MRNVISAPAIEFVKGHGTRNDFVLIPDLDGTVDVTAENVRFLCDRRQGLGADGVIRIARDAATGLFFMDYRNADGSIAEMCGNGARVFVRALEHLGMWRGTELDFLTRSGPVSAIVHPDTSISIDMGLAAPMDFDAHPAVRIGHDTWPCVGVSIPNPHAVVFVNDVTQAGDLVHPPEVMPGDAFPDGVNIEFVAMGAGRTISMRVHERGVGETMSCGTGACAAVWAAAREAGDDVRGVEWKVEVPGGMVFVTENADGRFILRGPAEIVAEGHVHLG